MVKEAVTNRTSNGEHTIVLPIMEEHYAESHNFFHPATKRIRNERTLERIYFSSTKNTKDTKSSLFVLFASFVKEN